jgi:hypothetical protein
MPFSSYASPEDVARTYSITLLEQNFLDPLPCPVPRGLRHALAYTRKHLSYDQSAYALCEGYIYPVLKEVWRSYQGDLMLWSHLAVEYDADLCGTPAYLVARRSPRGRWIVDHPYLVVMQAEDDDFTCGWAGCLAALIAVQRLNALPSQTLYGVTSNGQVWQFGQLQGTVFTCESRSFTLANLEPLYAALHGVFEQCRLQVRSQSPSAG